MEDRTWDAGDHLAKEGGFGAGQMVSCDKTKIEEQLTFFCSSLIAKTMFQCTQWSRNPYFSSTLMNPFFRPWDCFINVSEFVRDQKDQRSFTTLTSCHDVFLSTCRSLYPTFRKDWSRSHSLCASWCADNVSRTYVKRRWIASCRGGPSGRHSGRDLFRREGARCCGGDHKNGDRGHEAGE